MTLWTHFSVQFWNRLLNLAKRDFSKKNQSDHISSKKKNIPALDQNGFHLLSTKLGLNQTSFSRSDLKMVTVVAILDSEQKDFSNSESSSCPDASSFSSIWFTVWEEMWFEDFTIFTAKMLVTVIITGDYTCICIGSATEATTCI